MLSIRLNESRERFQTGSSPAVLAAALGVRFAY
jgi:hypothetical protein